MVNFACAIWSHQLRGCNVILSGNRILMLCVSSRWSAGNRRLLITRCISGFATGTMSLRRGSEMRKFLEWSRHLQRMNFCVRRTTYIPCHSRVAEEICSLKNPDETRRYALNATGWTCLGSRNCSPISQAFAMQTQTRATKFLKPPSNPTNAAPQRRAAGRRKALRCDTHSI